MQGVIPGTVVEGAFVITISAIADLTTRKKKEPAESLMRAVRIKKSASFYCFSAKHRTKY
jgi:hypothetical protein